MVPDVKREAQTTARRLPQRGGLAALVAQSRIEGIASRRSDGVAVRVRATNPKLRAVSATNRGRIKHPTGFKVKTGFAFQNVPPGWFTDAANAAAPELRRRLKAAVGKAIDKF